MSAGGSVDWACSSCTYINSVGDSCELCGTARETAEGAGPSAKPGSGHPARIDVDPDGPIILSDGDDDDAGGAARTGARTGAGGSGAGPGPSSAAMAHMPRDGGKAGRNTAAAAKPGKAANADADVTIIDDDDDDGATGAGAAAGSGGSGAASIVVDLTDAPMPPPPLIDAAAPPGWDDNELVGYKVGGSGAGANGGGSSAAGGSGGGDRGAESYTLDECAHSVSLSALADRLRSAVQASVAEAEPSVSAAPPANGGAAAAAPPRLTLLDLAAPLACPAGACGKSLSSRDVRLLLGPYGTHCLYGTLCGALRREAKAAKVAQSAAAAAGGGGGGPGPTAAAARAGGSKSRRRGGGNASAAEDTGAAAPPLPLAPSCPATVPAAAAPAAAAAAPSPEQRQVALLQAAIDVRAGGAGNGGAGSGSGDAGSLDELKAQLRRAVGDGCAFVCLRCPRTVADRDTLPKSRLQALQTQADAACAALALLRRTRALLLSAREEDWEEEEDGGEGGAGADGKDGSGSGSGAGGAGSQGGAGGGEGEGGGGRGRGRGRGRKRGRSGHDPDRPEGGKAWAKGVGYGGGGAHHYYSYGGGRGRGGGGGEGAAGDKAIKEAAERQRKGDEEVRRCLDSLAACLPSGSLASPPPLLMAALQGGGLPYVLRLLLQNDSLMDMGQRQGLYGAVLALVRRLVSNMGLLELLLLPAADPRDAEASQAAAKAAATATAAAATSAAGAGGSGGSGSGAGVVPGLDPPLWSVLESLGRQCSLFKRAAQELAEDADGTAALGLALELGAVAEEVAAGVDMWRGSMQGAAGLLAPFLPISGSCGVGDDADGSGEPAAKRPRRGGAAAAANGAGAAGAVQTEASAVQKAEYVALMRPLQFREVPLLKDFYFRQQTSGASAGGEQMRVRLRRITGELAGLASGLPLGWEAAAFVAVDEGRADVLRALLLPSSDTPYANGPFLFDILLPPQYPDVPPQVQFLTTGGGKVRFNPNLYAEGKVCLSLLGTWQGPSWEPGRSTLLQVLVSIHSMILVSDPYYNEPGWEAQAGSASGRQQAADYANSQRYNTLAFAILPALKMLTGASTNTAFAGGSTFTDVLRNHFRLKRAELERQCDDWIALLAASADVARRQREQREQQMQQMQQQAAAQRGRGRGGRGGGRYGYGGGRGGGYPDMMGLEVALGVAAVAPAGGEAQKPAQESPQELIHKYTGQVVPQIKAMLAKL